MEGRGGGARRRPPINSFYPDRKYIRNMCLFGAESTIRV